LSTPGFEINTDYLATTVDSVAASDSVATADSMSTDDSLTTANSVIAVDSLTPTNDSLTTTADSSSTTTDSNTADSTTADSTTADSTTDSDIETELISQLSDELATTKRSIKPVTEETTINDEVAITENYPTTITTTTSEESTDGAISTEAETKSERTTGKFEFKPRNPGIRTYTVNPSVQTG